MRPVLTNLPVIVVHRSEVVAHQALWAAKQAERKTNPKDAERERKRQEDELRTTAEQLSIVRRARMVELYATERTEWQALLAAKGLTIEPTIH